MHTLLSAGFSGNNVKPKPMTDSIAIINTSKVHRIADDLHGYTMIENNKSKMPNFFNVPYDADW
jgi:hypothetical protein